MTPTQLATDLGVFLKQVHANYFSDDAQVKGNPLLVVPGFLKMKESSKEDQYPHLVIRINKIEDTLHGSTVQLFLIHGVYSEDVEKGWMEITNFLETTRQALLAHPVIANRYRLVLDDKHGIDTDIPPDQAYPYWEGFMTVKYDIEQIREEMII